MSETLRTLGTGAKVALAAVVALALVFVIGVFGVYYGGWFSDVTKNRVGETEKNELIEGNGSYRVGAYESFWDAYAAIQTQEDRISNLTATTETQTGFQLQQTQLAITAAKNTCASLINDYNAASKADYTSAQFRDAQLPMEIQLEATKCAP